jgi:peptidoglycan/LPS O-acetylase OafA/YrhL
MRAPFVVALIAGGLVLGGYPSNQFPETTLYHAMSIPGLDNTQLMIVWHNLGAIMVLSGVLYWKRIQKWLNHGLFVGLGKLSFSLYLTHMIVMCSLGMWVFSVAHTYLGYMASVAVTVPITLLAMLYVSFIFTKLIDSPSIELARLIGRVFVRPAKPAPTPEAAPLPQPVTAQPAAARPVAAVTVPAAGLKVAYPAGYAKDTPRLMTDIRPRYRVR